MLTADPALIADIQRPLAAVGLAADIVAEVPEVLAAWSGAVGILVGADRVDLLAAALPTRRADVFVVAPGPPEVGLFAAALQCGAESVWVLPDDEESVAARLADLVDNEEVRQAAPSAAFGGSVASPGLREPIVVGVLGGVGGVGASTVAAALACRAAQRWRTLALDLDLGGVAICDILGLTGATVGWPDLAADQGRLRVSALRDALPRHLGVSVLGWSGQATSGLAGLDATVVRSVLAVALRGFEITVLALPRHQELTAELLGRCDRGVLVAPSTVTGVVATARSLAVLPTEGLTAVVRTTPGGLAPADCAAHLGLRLAGELPRQRRLDEAIGLGLGPIRRAPGLRRLADRILDDVVRAARHTSSVRTAR